MHVSVWRRMLLTCVMIPSLKTLLHTYLWFMPPTLLTSRISKPISAHKTLILAWTFTAWSQLSVLGIFLLQYYITASALPVSYFMFTYFHGLLISFIGGKVHELLEVFFWPCLLCYVHMCMCTDPTTCKKFKRQDTSSIEWTCTISYLHHLCRLAIQLHGGLSFFIW